MANRTDPTAKSIRGTNPQNLIGKIVQSKIYKNKYWKEQCFGLTAETLVDKAVELDHLGGTFGCNPNPTPFLCLVTKMLQIQPDKEIIVEFIKNDNYKYVRALGAFYLRLTGSDTDVYQYLEPLYNDYRKIRQKLADGSFSLTRVDEFIDELLTRDDSCSVTLPRIKKRRNLESIGELEPRISALEDYYDEEEENEKLGVVVEPQDESHEKDYQDSHRDLEHVLGRDSDRGGRRRSRSRDRKYRDNHRQRD